MANVPVQKIDANKPALAPVLEAAQETFDRIQKRAFELFERRGRVPGFELEDWLRAEHELFWVPQAELTESKAQFNLKVAVPGFEARDLDITVQPYEILIQGAAEKREQKMEAGVTYSEFGERTLYRRFTLPAPIDLGSVTAQVENGLLVVIAPKKNETAREIPAAA